MDLETCSLTPGGGIACLICGYISYRPTDVVEKYCGSCHRYHEAMSVALRSFVTAVKLLAPHIQEDEYPRLFVLLLASIELRKEKHA